MNIQEILFDAVGTCGQRCTSIRRVFVHVDIYDKLVSRLKKSYQGLSTGNPFDPKRLVDPLIDQQAYHMEAAFSNVTQMIRV